MKKILKYDSNFKEYPKRIVLWLTWQCNLNCLMCNVHGENSK